MGIAAHGRTVLCPVADSPEKCIMLIPELLVNELLSSALDIGFPAGFSQCQYANAEGQGIHGYYPVI